MHKVFCLLLTIAFTQQALTQPTEPASYSSIHQRAFTSKPDLVYDHPAWVYAAAGPIRSTPLAVDGQVYAATTNGELACLNQQDGKLLWRMRMDHPLNASPAYYRGNVYIADGGQTLYAVHALTGKLQWKYNMGEKKAYPWRFDYFYSSPVIENGVLYIGGDDGFVHAVSAANGKLIWKHAARSIVRSSPALMKQLVLFGDMDGQLVALDKKTGKQVWTFSAVGDTLKNEDWGFDRKGILSSPVVAGNRILFGCRDGYFYCINENGRQAWRVDHQVSWVISTLAVKDSIVVTGTSDGRFVQAVNLLTGKELWKFRPNALFWSSAAIVNEQVYIGSFDGVMYALDLRSGRRLSQFSTDDKILSSAVFQNGKLFFGCDNGKLYALKRAHGSAVSHAKTLCLL
jgi:eukaryotic-like serine/threonine-protein kinase